MPDYKEMYLIMARAAEKAQRILIEAQRQCEELYLSADDAEKPENGKGVSRTYSSAPQHQAAGRFPLEQAYRAARMAASSSS